MRASICFVVLLVASACSKREGETGKVVSDEQLAGYQQGAEIKRDEITTEWPAWLKHPEGCPADQMPAQFRDHAVSPEACQGEQINACLKQCEFFDPAACYNAALIIESPDLSVDPVSPALFARACAYGSASGCTNWTASLVVQALDEDAPRYTKCQERSFEATCTRAKDPWGCAMFAHALSEQGPDADRARIEQAIGVACRLGQDDPACQTAQGVLRSLKEN